MLQNFKFPMEFLRVSQGEKNTYSHSGSLAMDFGGKDSGIDKLYCPCDMKVMRCRHNANGELYLESTLPVKFADGTEDYARLLCMHDGSFNVTEGQILTQGQYFYDEGGMGAGNPNKFASHVHIEAGKGKWKSTTQAPNSYGTYVIEDQTSLYDLFILGDDVQIIGDGGYSWIYESDMKNEAKNTKECKNCTNKQAEINLLKKASEEQSALLMECEKQMNEVYISVEWLVNEKNKLVAEKQDMEAERDLLKTEIDVLKREKGVLKETIISLQEQIEDIRSVQHKSLFEKIIDILFGGA